MTGSRRHGFLVLIALLGLGLLVQACSDNKGPAGPTFGAGEVGHADTAAQIVVQVAINPGTIELGRRAGITVLVTNTNGRPLANRHVQLSTTLGTIDQVDGFTDALGKFVSFIRITAQDAENAQGLTQATVTAFVEGAQGQAFVNFGTLQDLTLTPGTVVRAFTETVAGAGCNVGSVVVQFTAAGGVPPYSFSTSGVVNSTITSGGRYTLPPLVVPAGTTINDTVTVVDSSGLSATATVAISCSAMTGP
jgi:hypothetical protein